MCLFFFSPNGTSFKIEYYCRTGLCFSISIRSRTSPSEGGLCVCLGRARGCEADLVTGVGSLLNTLRLRNYILYPAITVDFCDMRNESQGNSISLPKIVYCMLWPGHVYIFTRITQIFHAQEGKWLSDVILTTNLADCVCVCVCVCVRKMWPISALTPSFLLQTSRIFFSHSKIPIRCLWTAFCVPLSYIFYEKTILWMEYVCWM